jgi:hypothetical protein
MRTLEGASVREDVREGERWGGRGSGKMESRTSSEGL